MKNKTKLTKMKKDYLKVPIATVNINLSPIACKILLEMINCGEDFDPSLAYLESKTELSRATLTRAIRELRNQNVIKLVKRGSGRTTSRYEFIAPAHWLEKRKDKKNSVSKDKKLKLGRIAGGKSTTLKRLSCPKGKVVDYIIPIESSNICGLNVAWNIQFITLKEKIRKGNAFDGTYDNESWRT